MNASVAEGASAVAIAASVNSSLWANAFDINIIFVLKFVSRKLSRL